MPSSFIRLDKDSAIPLYQQLLNAIRERIATGEWKPGMRLPTENTLAADLGISRVTVRQATSAAVEAGLLVRAPGKGTYIAQGGPAPAPHGFIGYLVPSLAHSFNVLTLLGVESILKTEGYQLVFATSEGDLAEEERQLSRFDAQNVAGYIVQPVHEATAGCYLSQLVARHRPLVLVDRLPTGLEADLVSADHFAGGYAVVRHLIGQGYTDIVYLARPPLALSSVAERYRAYQAAMRDAGLTPQPPFVIDQPHETGYREIQQALTDLDHPPLKTIFDYLRSPQRPQAIVAMNDLHALLVLVAAGHAGVRVPNDLAVVGFDDLDFAATLNPPLTTVAQPPYEMGVEAARLLLARIAGQSGGAKQVRLPTRLVVRASSRSLWAEVLSPAGEEPAR